MEPRRLPKTTPKGDQNESKKGPQNDDFRGAFLEQFSTPFGGPFWAHFWTPPNPVFHKKSARGSSESRFFFEHRDSEGALLAPFSVRKSHPQKAPKMGPKMEPTWGILGGVQSAPFWYPFGVTFWSRLPRHLGAHFWLIFGPPPDPTFQKKSARGSSESRFFFWEIEGWTGALFGHPFLVTFAV